MSGALPGIPVDLGPGALDRPSCLGGEISLDGALIGRLAGACAVVDTDASARLEASRDWWPIAARWAVDGTVPAHPGVVCRPSSAAEVAAVLQVCHQARVPITAYGGRSGVCGGSVPVAGGVSVDLTALDGIVAVDDGSLLVDVRAGTFGDLFEAALRAEHGLTLGHWPQSIA